MLEDRRLPSTLPVAIAINGTSDPGDDLTLYDPGVYAQTIPAVVTNDGTPRTITLQVSPPGAITLDQSTLTLAANASATVTITPDAVSQAANDVTLTATALSDGAVVGVGTLTVVSVLLPQDVRNADTPAGMPDRIPPRVATPIGVQVVPDLSASGQSVTLTVAGQSPSNGTVLLDGQSAVTLSSSGSVALTGTTQTAPTPLPGGGNARHLSLVAQVRGQGTVASAGFSVAAIPENWSETFVKAIRTNYLGLRVQCSYESDSGVLTDLSAVSVREMIQDIQATGILANVRGTPTGYLPATLADGQPDTLVDTHTLMKSYVRKPGGSEVTAQTHLFRDQRTGAVDIPVTNSGYLIVRVIARGRKGSWRLTTTEMGAATVAQGFASAAGAGGPFSVTQKA
jgi:hypothetical protein